MTEKEARILEKLLETQRRCANRILVKDKEGEYRDAALWITTQKALDVIVSGASA